MLITAGQPSLNPRLVKEADALVEAGYEVTVIYQYWNDWATGTDQKLLEAKKWRAIRVGGSPNEHRFAYWKSRLGHKLGRILAKSLFRIPLVDRLAIGRCTDLLVSAAKRVKADLYIGHNLAALPAAVMAARLNKAKAGFDAEDFHRHETSDDINDPECRLKMRVENYYLPQTYYMTTSSPAITQAYEAIYRSLRPKTILNTFDSDPSELFSRVRSDALKMVWFSQTIGFNRGIKDILQVMEEVPEVELHLLGDHNQAAIDMLRGSVSEAVSARIFFYAPIASTEIIPFCSQFEIGLALEPGFSINNNLALSNKIFSYIQAGLAVIASDTIAQRRFMEEHPALGFTYQRGDLKTLKHIVDRYLSDRKLLEQHQLNARLLGSTRLNWRTEKEKFLAIIDKVLESD